MKKQRILSMLLAFMLLFASFGTATTAAVTTSVPEDITQEDQSAVDDLSGTLEELQKKIDQLEKEKKENLSKQSDAKTYQATLDKQIKATEQKIILLQKNITKNESEIESLEQNISVLEENIAANLEKFRQRVRAIYISGRTSELEMLLSSDNFVDMLTRAEILRRISEYDNNLINNLINDKNDTEAKKAQVEEKKATLVSERTDVKKTSTKLDAMYEENAAALTALKKDEKENAAIIAAAKKEAEEIEAEIDDILSKYKSTIEYNGGEYAWPLPGFSKITSPYGVKRSNGTVHTGTDIAGRNSEGDLCLGYSIVAVADGIVIDVLNKGNVSYGRYLIIDHGSGRKSLYAHCSSVVVQKGQKVTKGQVIAKAGSTGNSTGPHLHIELWINDKRVDPMSILKQP